jgi:hypothetical protein
MECLIQSITQPADLLAGNLGHAERAANGRTRGLPRGAIEQTDARIGIAKARCREDVPAPQRSAQPVDKAQGPGATINQAVLEDPVFP